MPAAARSKAPDEEHQPNQGEHQQNQRRLEEIFAQSSRFQEGYDGEHCYKPH
jgi:hypothetical protein